jgi:hypothetical protein
MLLSVIVYFATGYTTDASQFLEFYLILFLTAFCANSLGYVISCSFNNETSALASAPLVLLP